MADKNKAGREDRKKTKLSIKEKRKLKNEKKKNKKTSLKTG